MDKKNLRTQNVSYLTGFYRGLVGLGILMGVLWGCGEDPQQLFETAQFEEQQHNQAHAKELYERIVREHGNSPVANKAQARLKELEKDH